MNISGTPDLCIIWELFICRLVVVLYNADPQQPQAGSLPSPPSESASTELYLSDTLLSSSSLSPASVCDETAVTSLQAAAVYTETLMGCSEGTNKSLEPFSPQQQHQSVTLISAGLLLFSSHVRLSTKTQTPRWRQPWHNMCGGFHQSEQMEGCESRVTLRLPAAEVEESCSTHGINSQYRNIQSNSLSWYIIDNRALILQYCAFFGRGGMNL